MSNLKEIYQLFKEKFPTESIGFSKFAELHPKHCVLAGASGTHAVRVCTIHQNVKLMMLGGKLLTLQQMRIRHSNHMITAWHRSSAIHHNLIVTWVPAAHVLGHLG